MSETKLGISNASANETTDMIWHGGGTLGISAIAAGWGGGTAKIQFRAADNTTWLDVPSMALTANGMLYTQLPQGFYRLAFTGATGPSGVYANLLPG